MPQRRLRQLYTTPPPDLVVKASDRPFQLETPQRSAIHAVLYFCQQQKLPCNFEEIHTVFGIPSTTVGRVAASNRCRRLANSDFALETRGNPRLLTASDAQAIGSYIKQAPFYEKADPWQDLAERAGVVKEYTSDKENIQYHNNTIHRHVTAETTIKTHKAIVKEKHTPEQRRLRVQYAIHQLILRPTAKSWRNVLWCDELHWSTGPRYQKDVKREAGDAAREHWSNIQYDKNHKPEEKDIEKFHLFCVLGYDFAWCIPYDAGNKNGKMNSKTFTEVILPALKAYLLERGGDWILWMDRDSAYCSKTTLKYMDKNGWDYIISAPKSPDMSIMETWVSPLRRRFFNRRCWSVEAGLQRFYEVWQGLNPKKINRTIDNYPRRLKKLKDDYKGWATKY